MASLVIKHYDIVVILWRVNLRERWIIQIYHGVVIHGRTILYNILFYNLSLVSIMSVSVWWICSTTVPRRLFLEIYRVVVFLTSSCWWWRPNELLWRIFSNDHVFLTSVCVSCFVILTLRVSWLAVQIFYRPLEATLSRHSIRRRVFCSLWHTRRELHLAWISVIKLLLR